MTCYQHDWLQSIMPSAAFTLQCVQPRLRFLQPVQRRHNEHGGVSNRPGVSSVWSTFVHAHVKEISKFRIAGLCEGNPPVTGRFPSQRASNAEMFPFDDAIMFQMKAVFSWPEASRSLTGWIGGAKLGMILLFHKIVFTHNDFILNKPYKNSCILHCRTSIVIFIVGFWTDLYISVCCLPRVDHKSSWIWIFWIAYRTTDLGYAYIYHVLDLHS